ncbi:MAG: Calx-beta domain-containing protein [Nannocystales bacterium]
MNTPISHLHTLVLISSVLCGCAEGDVVDLDADDTDQAAETDEDWDPVAAASPAPTLRFKKDAYFTNEGTGKANVVVQLSQASSSEVSVAYKTRSGTARATDDFHWGNDVLVFAPGQTRKTVTVDLRDDDKPEDDEIFTVRLSNPKNANITTGSVNVTIVDDDGGSGGGSGGSSGSACPSDDDLLWEDDFTPFDVSDYHKQYSCAASSLDVVNGALRITTDAGPVTPGCSYFSNNEYEQRKHRTELSVNASRTPAGEPLWLKFRFKLASDNLPVGHIFLQMNGSEPNVRSNPEIIFHRQGSNITVNIMARDGNLTVGPAQTDEWVDMVVHVKQSRGNDGFLKVWMNGEKRIDYTGKTKRFADQTEQIFKFGNYWGETSGSGNRVAFFDDLKIGSGAPPACVLE